MSARPTPHEPKPATRHESGFTPSPVLPEAGRVARAETPSGARSVVELTSPIGHRLRVPASPEGAEPERPSPKQKS